MKSFSYIKMNGAGNDFVLIDRKINPEIELSATKIAMICDREKGIGADGILIINDSVKTDFEMEYYNADGSTGSLCGNGARCVIKYAAISHRIDADKTKFMNNGRVFNGDLISENIVKFYLNDPTDLRTNLNVEINKYHFKANFVNTGSPHLIINIDEEKHGKLGLQDLEVKEIGRKIRFLDQFKPDGVNVNFIKFENDNNFIRSYERGVEAETLACGTGTVAAAIISNLIYKKNPPIKFITKSNAELIVNFEVEKNMFKNISLTGPVEIEFEGNYSI